MSPAYTEEREERIRSRRSKRKQGRIARLRRQVLRYTVLATLLYVGCAGLVKVPWAPMDANEDIQIQGNQVVTAAQIKAVLAPHMRRPVYTLDPHQLAAEIRNLPAVHMAGVRRYILPRPHIVVYVMEEFPWASLAHAPGEPVQAVISQTGRMIPVSEYPAVAQPQLLIYGNPDFKFSQSDVVSWANWTQYVSTQTGRSVNSLDLRQANNIKLQAGDLALRLGSADTTLSKRLSRLSSIVPALAQLKDTIEYIDLGLDANVPVRISKEKKERSPLATPENVSPAHSETTVASTTQPL